MGSLKEICKRRILIDMVRRTSLLQGYVAMIVDKLTLRILSSCCNMSEILEEGAVLVEEITSKRQATRDIDALYFLTPKDESISLMLKDFSDPQNRKYNNAYIFFSQPTSSEMMKKISQSPGIIPHIRCMFDFNMSFIAYEQRVFHFDLPNAMLELFPSPNSTILEVCAEKLLTFCCSIGESPLIRFHDNGGKLTKNLAIILDQKLKNAAIPKNNNFLLLILDRSIDLATLLNHEYTYQALAYDLINIISYSKLEDSSLEDSNKFSDVFTYEIPGDGKKEQKMAILSESDSLWVRFRHEHIQIVNKEVLEEIQKFSRENPAARVKSDKPVSAEETMKAARAIPEFQELISRFWTHVSLSEACFKKLQEQHLFDIGEIEQDISCGIDKKGKELNTKHLNDQIVKSFADDAMDQETKLRVLMLFLSQFYCIPYEEKSRILSSAGLSLENQTIISNFLSLGIHETAVTDESFRSTKQLHRTQLDSARKKNLKNIAKTASFQLSRFEPIVKSLMLQCLDFSLPKSKFPYVEEPTRTNFFRENISSKDNFVERSLQNTKWDWNDFSSPKNNEVNQISDSSELNENSKQTIVIFIAGNISFAEIRSAYEVSREKDAQVYIGGLIPGTGKDFLHLLKNFKDVNKA